MIKDAKLIETSTIVAYSESMEKTQIAFMLSQGAKSHLYKSRSFSIFCNDLVLLLDQKTAD
jgi:hypothetical protein